MSSSRFKHIIYTRFGIGVQRVAFHERRLAIMKASLLPCIAAQTNPNVHWLLVTDSRAPESIRAALEGLRQSVPNLHLRTVDPLVEYSLGGFKKEFIEQIAGNDEIVFLSRVDDDDAINQRFSEIVVAFLEEQLSAGGSLPIAATWTRGLEMYVGENKGRIANMPWLAPSIGVATRVDNFFDFMTTHWGVGERAIAAGGAAHDIVDQEPMWAWLRHKDSDSAEFRRIRRQVQRLPSSDGLLMSGFPFVPEELAQAYAGAGDERPPEPELVDGVRPGKTRLEFKQHTLQTLLVLDGLIGAARTNGDARAMDSLGPSRAMLASLFYSL